MGRTLNAPLVLGCGFESVVVLRGQMDRENMMSHDEIDKPAFPSIGPGKEWFEGLTRLEFTAAIIMSGLVVREDHDKTDAVYAVELARAIFEAAHRDHQNRMNGVEQDYSETE